MKLKGIAWNIFLFVSVIVVVIAAIFPIFWLFLLSVKQGIDQFSLPPKFIPWLQFEPTLDHYTYILFKRGNINTIFNSTIVLLLAVPSSTLISSLAAYAINRFKTGGTGLRFGILSLQMTPPIVAAIPIYLIFKFLGLLDMQATLALVYTTIFLPFGIWIMEGFFDAIPREIDEAALVDGCSRLTALVRVVLPVALPGLVATAIFISVMCWNEFVFALVLTNVNKTVPILAGGTEGADQMYWGEMGAISSIIMIPPLVFAAYISKYLVRGLTFGAVKS